MKFYIIIQNYKKNKFSIKKFTYYESYQNYKMAHIESNLSNNNLITLQLLVNIQQKKELHPK